MENSDDISVTEESINVDNFSESIDLLHDCNIDFKSFSKINKIILNVLTEYAKLIYEYKLILNVIVGSLLGYIIASNFLSDKDPWKKAYVALSLIIIIFILIETFIRNKSSEFNLLDSMLNPIVFNGDKIIHIIKYDYTNHYELLVNLLVIELIKIGAGIFCIIDLVRLNIDGVFLNYLLLSLLLLESSLGMITHLFSILLVLIDKKSYIKCLNYTSEKYVRHIANCKFYENDTGNIYMIITPKKLVFVSP